VELSSLKTLNKIYPLAVKGYETFMPNMDEGDIVTKMNSLVAYLNSIGKLSNDTVTQWNKVMQWILSDGLTESVDKKIVELVTSGEFEGLLQEGLSNLNVVVNEKLGSFESSLTQKASNQELSAVDTQLKYVSTKNPYIVIEGDSTAKGGTAGASMGLWLSMLMKREVINNAVWGSWTQQVKDRLKTSVLDLHPKYCILLMGTNDIHGGEIRTKSLENYEYILDTLITNNIEPIVVSVLPRNDFPNDNANIRIFNSCLLHMCQEKSIKFIDLYNPLAKGDGSALDYILHNADNLHWSTYGSVLGAKEVVKAFTVPKQNNVDYPHNLFKGEYPIIENGIFAGTVTNGLGIYWTALDTVNTTFSQEVNPKGGNLQVINKSTNVAVTSGIKQTIGAFTENATYRLQGEIEFTLTDRTDGGNNNASTFISLEFLNGSGAVISSILIDEVWYSTGIPLTQFYKDFTPPNGTVSTRLTVCANATSPFTLKVGGLYANVIR
jgi:lysophospholipase L1-like esterase